MQRLHVSIGRYKLHTLHVGVNHAVHRVAAAAADADDFDARVVAGLFIELNSDFRIGFGIAHVLVLEKNSSSAGCSVTLDLGKTELIFSRRNFAAGSEKMDQMGFQICNDPSTQLPDYIEARAKNVRSFPLSPLSSFFRA